MLSGTGWGRGPFFNARVLYTVCSVITSSLFGDRTAGGGRRRVGVLRGTGPGAPFFGRPEEKKCVGERLRMRLVIHADAPCALSRQNPFSSKFSRSCFLVSSRGYHAYVPAYAHSQMERKHWCLKGLRENLRGKSRQSVGAYGTITNTAEKRKKRIVPMLALKRKNEREKKLSPFPFFSSLRKGKNETSPRSQNPPFPCI